MSGAVPHAYPVIRSCPGVLPLAASSPNPPERFTQRPYLNVIVRVFPWTDCHSTFAVGLKWLFCCLRRSHATNWLAPSSSRRIVDISMPFSVFDWLIFQVSFVV